MSTIEQRPFLSTLHLAHSPYLRVLRHGFLMLRFPPEMEDEYRRARDPVLRQRTAASALVGMLAVLTWFALDGLTAHQLQFATARIVFLGWLLPLLAVLFFTAAFFRRQQPLSSWLILSIDLAISLGLIYLQAALGNRELINPFPYFALLLVIFSIFLNGLMTVRATLTCVAIALCFTVASLHFGAGPPGFGASAAGLPPGFPAPGDFLSHSLFFLAATILIGMAGSWRIEHSDREQFLMARLMQELAEHDGLTGLLNHAAFMSHCERAWRQAARENKPVGLLMTDIDYFKRYNDRYGHDAGDRCLRRVARAVAKGAGRGFDCAGRLGGEEFALFLYDIPAADVATTASKLCGNVAALNIAHEDSTVAACITVSVGGIGKVPTRAGSLRAALREADTNLYAAKKAGRNRAVTTGAG